MNLNHKVGKNLPCVDSIEETGVAEFNKTISSRDFDDTATFAIGPTCPVNRAGMAEDNQFRANIIYELPPSAAIIDGSEYLNFVK